MALVSGAVIGNLTGLYRQIALRVASVMWLFPRAGLSFICVCVRVRVRVRVRVCVCCSIVPFVILPFLLSGTLNTTWGKSDVIVQTPTRNYTAYDYEELLLDLGLSFLIPELRAIVVSLCNVLYEVISCTFFSLLLFLNYITIIN